MGTMRALLERLTGRYRFAFKPARPVGAGSQGPDTLLVAQPTKLVRVELEYYAPPDRWHATIFDADAPEDDPHGIVGGQAFAKGLTQDEAEEAAIEVTLKYLSQKRRPVREATASMMEGVVTFRPHRTQKGGFYTEPRDGVQVEVLKVPGRSAEEYEVSIYDEEAPAHTRGEAALVVPLYVRDEDELMRKARRAVTFYLKAHPTGWSRAQ